MKKMTQYPHISKIVSILFVSFVVLFIYIFRSEFYTGIEGSMIRIVSLDKNNEEALGHYQDLRNIKINGSNVDMNQSMVETDQTHLMTTGTRGIIMEGPNQEVRFPISSVSTLSFDYVSGSYHGIIQIYIDDQLIEEIDTYTEYYHTNYYYNDLSTGIGISRHNIGWYLAVMVTVFAGVYLIKHNLWKNDHFKWKLMLIGILTIGLYGVLKIISQFYHGNSIHWLTSTFSIHSVIVGVGLIGVFLLINSTVLEVLLKHYVEWLRVVYLGIPFFVLYLLQAAWSTYQDIASPFFMINILLISMVIVVLSLFLTSIRMASVVLVAIAYGTSIINKILIDTRNIPLQSYHLRQVQDGLNVADTVVIELNHQVIIMTLFSTLFLMGIISLPLKRQTIPQIKTWQLSLVGVVSLLLLPFMTTTVTSQVETEFYFWRMANSYAEKGFLFSFIELYNRSKITEPDNYSIAKAEEILQEYPDNLATGLQPNIVLIQNESLYDFNSFEGMELMPNPFVHMHRAAEEGIAGDLTVSVYGGGTANSEYEVLSSHALSIFPPGTFPFQQLLNKSNRRPSIATELANQGYKTIGMHPQTLTNYNRDNAWMNLGINETYFTDSTPDIASFVEYDHVRNYVSDATLYQGTMNLINDREEPIFSFVATMQGHGGYDQPEANQEVLVNGDADLLQESVYFSTMKESDEGFGQLMDQLNQSDEPTIVMMYGDHQPTLSDEFYNKYMPGAEIPYQYKTNYVIWANFDLPEKDYGTISPNYLMPVLLDVLSETDYALDVNSFYQFLLEAMDTMPVMTTWGYYDPNTDEYIENPVDDEVFSQYSSLQYYRAIDKRYPIEPTEN